MLRVSPHGWPSRTQLLRRRPPPEPPPVASKTIAEIFRDREGQKSPAKSPKQGEVGAAAQRAAEWGLVLKTDEETGKPQGVKVRTSGDEPNKAGNSRRDSGNSVRSSGDLSDDGTGDGLILILN
ncbi:phototropin-1-like [Sesamum indicum]|uniref:Phototropin-1-like n=1 Tax=Sesamum indicum TaxID=4182 RepID=A0A8M8V079_SESIN|nr:phototropin-1-like [Sesamum indicum]